MLCKHASCDCLSWIFFSKFGVEFHMKALVCVFEWQLMRLMSNVADKWRNACKHRRPIFIVHQNHANFHFINLKAFIIKSMHKSQGHIIYIYHNLWCFFFRLQKRKKSHLVISVLYNIWWLKPFPDLFPFFFLSWKCLPHHFSCH